jgi:asparagine synthase (glutamine-hydrolysing)
MHMERAYGFSLRAGEWEASDDPRGDRLFQRLTASLLPHPGESLFKKPYRPWIPSLARGAFDRGFEASAGLQPGANRVSHLFLNQHLPHVTARSMEKFRSSVDTRLPFVDADLIAAIMRMPPQIRQGDRIQSELLRRRAPALLSIPNANTGAPVGAGRVSRFAHHTAKRVLAKLGVSGYQPYERIGRWLRRDWYPTARHLLLGEASLDRGVLEPGVVSRVLDEHRSGSRNHTGLIMTMLAFEAGQEELLGNDDGH